MLLSEFEIKKPSKHVIEIHEDEHENPMRSAVLGRIARGRLDLIEKYGIEAVMTAVDDVTEGDTDWEEIGSSDVSAYVKYVEDRLRDRFVGEAKSDYNFDIEDLKRLERISDLETLKAQALALISKPSAKPMKPEKVQWFKNAMEKMNSPLKVIKLMYDLMLSGEGNAVIGSRNSMNPNSYRQRFGESLRPGEYHIATVTLDNGEKKKFKVTWDEGYTDIIKNYYAKQGHTVTNISMDWSVQQGPMNEKEEHGDLRTGWLAKAAKRAFPMAGSDMEALAMWINDKLEKDVSKLSKENDQEEKDITRLDKENDREDKEIDNLENENEVEQNIISKISQDVSMIKNRVNDIERNLTTKESANFSSSATNEEISKYLAEMKNDGYDIRI